MEPYQPSRVVIPVDPSELPYQALEMAIRLVGAVENAHILAVLPASEATGNWGTIDGESRAEYAMRDLKKRLSTTPYANAHHHVVFGSPAAEIAKFAEEIGADLVVLPCRNRQSRLSRLVNGSVAEDLLRIAPCPVLALPINPEAKPAEKPRPASGTPGHRGGW